MFSLCFLYIIYCNRETIQQNATDKAIGHQERENEEESGKLTVNQQRQDEGGYELSENRDRTVKEYSQNTKQSCSLNFDTEDSSDDEYSSSVFSHDAEKGGHFRCVSVAYIEPKTGWRVVCCFSKNSDVKVKSIMLISMRKLR